MSVNGSRDIYNSQSNENVPCNIYGRGLLLHLNAGRRKQKEQQNQKLEANDDQENTNRMINMPREPINEPFYWNEKPGTTFANELNNAYGKIVYWRKHVFLLPTGTAGNVLLTK